MHLTSHGLAIALAIAGFSRTRVSRRGTLEPHREPATTLTDLRARTTRARGCPLRSTGFRSASLAAVGTMMAMLGAGLAVGQVVPRFEGQTVAHYTYDVSVGGTVIEAVKLYVTPAGGPPQLIATAPAGNPARVTGQTRVAGLVAGQHVSFSVSYKTVEDGSKTGTVGGDLRSSNGVISGTLLFDETVTSLPIDPPWVSVVVPSQRELKMVEVEVKGPLLLDGGGVVDLDRVKGVDFSSGSPPTQIAANLVVRNSIFTAGAGFKTTGEVSVEDTFFGSGCLLQASKLTVKSCDFYHPHETPGLVSLEAEGGGFSLTNSVFISPPVLGFNAGTQPAVTGNSFLQGLNTVPAGSRLPGNYWGGPKGPRTQSSNWLDGQGWQTGGGDPAVDFLAAGNERATTHSVEIAPSRIYSLGFRIGQNVSGGIIRKGRETLVSIDARTQYGARQAADLRLRIGAALIAPANPIAIRRDFGPPTADVGNQERTVNFIIPPRDESLFNYEVIDTDPPAGVSELMTQGTIVQQAAPGRPLRLAILPLVIDGYRKSFLTGNAGRGAEGALRRNLAAMLPLTPDEIEIEVLPEARYKLGYSALYVIVSQSYMLNECSAVLRGHLTRLNAARAAPFDFLVCVVPNGTLGTDALGVSLPFRREVIMVDEVSPESAIHEMGHGLGFYNTIEQYTVLWDGYDDTGTYYKSGYGARIEACTAFIPGDTAAVPPIVNRIRHFPFGVDSNVWDIMGGDGAQWITAATHIDLGGALLSRLRVPSPAPPRGRDARDKRDGPPPGRRRVLLEGLLDPVPSPFFHYPILRESLHCGIAPPDMGPIRESLAGGHDFHAYDAAGVPVHTELCLVEHRLTGTVQPWIQTFDVPESAVRYEIVDQWTREVIFIQKATPSMGIVLQPPTSSPDGAAVGLSWTFTGALPSGRPLDVTLHVSSDGGGTWRFLGDYDELTGVTLPLDLFPAVPLRFKAVVSDGIGTVESVSPAYQPPVPATPEVVISRPWDGAKAPIGTRWTFSSRVTPSATDQTAAWHSSRDGALGSGFTLGDVVLSPGAHVITVTVQTPGRPNAQHQIAVEVADLGTVDLALDAGALSFATSMLDPIQGQVNQPISGRPCRVRLTTRNPGAQQTARLQVYLQPPGGAESMLSDETFSWGPLAEREQVADFLPTAAGSYQVRAVLSHVGPPELTEINPANNQRLWMTANARPVGHGYIGTVREKRNLDLELTADDVDGDSIQFTIVTPPAHGTLTGTAPRLTYRPHDGYFGLDHFVFRPSDLFGSGADVTATLRVVPAPPVFLGSLAVTAEQYHPFSYTALHEGTAVDVSVAFPPLLTGLTYTPASYTVAGISNRAGVYGLLFSLENPAGRLEPSVRVDFRPNDDRPVLTSARLVESVVGGQISYSATGSYFPTAIEYEGLPPGVFSFAGGALTGSPEKSGAFRVRVGLTNNAGTSWETIELRISSNHLPPGLPQNSVFGTIGQPMSWALRAFYEPTHFEISELPVGLTLDAATGVISGVPEQGGSILVMLEASNVYGADSEIMGFSITIPAGYPVLTDPGPLTLAGGVASSVQLGASPGPATFLAEGLPAGLGLNPSTGQLSGTPTQIGEFTPIIRVTNGAGTTASRLRLTVTPGTGMPLITSAPVLNGALGGAADFLLTGTNAPSFTVAGLPEGLVFNASTRRITGLFRVAGSRYLTVTATNAKGQSSMLMLVTVTAGYAGWTSLNGLSGSAAQPTADPDLDRSTNLSEYLANSDPRSASSWPLFTIARDSGYGVLHFRCRSPDSGLVTGAFQAGGVSCALERSFTLASGAGAWGVDPAQFGMATTTPNDDGTIEVFVPLLGSPGAGGGFFRLSATP